MVYVAIIKDGKVFITKNNTLLDKLTEKHDRLEIIEIEECELDTDVLRIV